MVCDRDHSFLCRSKVNNSFYPTMSYNHSLYTDIITSNYALFQVIIIMTDKANVVLFFLLPVHFKKNSSLEQSERAGGWRQNLSAQNQVDPK